MKKEQVEDRIRAEIARQNRILDLARELPDGLDILRVTESGGRGLVSLSAEEYWQVFEATNLLSPVKMLKIGRSTFKPEELTTEEDLDDCVIVAPFTFDISKLGARPVKVCIKWYAKVGNSVVAVNCEVKQHPVSMFSEIIRDDYGKKVDEIVHREGFPRGCELISWDMGYPSFTAYWYDGADGDMSLKEVI